MNEQELKLEKIKKSCNVTATVTKVLESIMVALAMICLSSAILCFAIRGQIDAGVAEYANRIGTNDFVEAFSSINSSSIGGVVSFTLDASGLLEEGAYGAVCALYSLVGAFICAMVVALFDVIRRVFKTLKTSETPFDDEVIKKIKRLFIVVTVEVLIMFGVGTAVLTGLVCWSIYNILDYGFTLQKQIDETL